MQATLKRPAQRRQLVIGPEDDGRRMTLDRFDRAIGREGHIYELNKGVIEVSGIPLPQHAVQVDRIRRQLDSYQDRQDDEIQLVLSGGESKILLASEQSERHPDLSVYSTQPPTDNDDT